MSRKNKLIMNPLYFNEQTNEIYINLDGGLRLIGIEAYNNLYEQPFNEDNCSKFANSDSAPLPILRNWPIMQDTHLYTLPEASGVYYFQDKYPWGDTVYREIEITDGLISSGFDYTKTIEVKIESNEVGVPLIINSNLNIDAIQNLKGYLSVYGYFMFGGVILNPYFEYLLARFPGYGGSGSNHNKKFKPELKALLNYYGKIVNKI